MLPATIVRPLLGAIPSVLIMRAFGRAQREALARTLPGVSPDQVIRRRTLSGLVDFANYAPTAAPFVQRMRDCLLLMVVIGFPVFAVALFWR